MLVKSKASRTHSSDNKMLNPPTASLVLEATQTLPNICVTIEQYKKACG
jgi:hypothetical protein